MKDLDWWRNDICKFMEENQCENWNKTKIIMEYFYSKGLPEDVDTVNWLHGLIKEKWPSWPVVEQGVKECIRKRRTDS
jgi:hypothetical protein